jgi:dienelactone hydrolase
MSLGIPVAQPQTGKEETMMAKSSVLVPGFLLAILVAALPAIAAEQVRIAARTEAGEEMQLPGILHKPGGSGPFPAVVMLCGCGGFAKKEDAMHQATWAQRLVGWGYVALRVDSFSPRGPSNICEDTSTVSDDMRSHDAYSAKAYLSALPFVDPRRIAVMGWSHGGWAVMKIIDGYYRDKTVDPFKAAVAFYPYCQRLYGPDTPLLVLIGKKDDWCPASYCESLKQYGAYNDSKYEFTLKIYPNAYHAFDFEGLKEDLLGHHAEYDPEAASDAISQARDFLARYLAAR